MSLAEDHPDLYRTYNNLAMLESSQGNKDLAFSILKA